MKGEPSLSYCTSDLLMKSLMKMGWSPGAGRGGAPTPLPQPPFSRIPGVTVYQIYAADEEPDEDGL